MSSRARFATLCTWLVVCILRADKVTGQASSWHPRRFRQTLDGRKTPVQVVPQSFGKAAFDDTNDTEALEDGDKPLDGPFSVTSLASERAISGSKSREQSDYLAAKDSGVQALHQLQGASQVQSKTDEDFIASLILRTETSAPPLVRDGDKPLDGPFSVMSMASERAASGSKSREQSDYLASKHSGAQALHQLQGASQVQSKTDEEFNASSFLRTETITPLVRELDTFVLKQLFELTENNTRAMEEKVTAFRESRKAADRPDMICLEDCAMQHWQASDSGGEDKPYNETNEPCSSSCCFGCTLAIDGIRGTKFAGRSFNVEEGASGAEVYRSRDVTGRQAYVKFNCIPGGQTSFPAKRPRLHSEKERSDCAKRLVKGSSRTEVSMERHKQLVEIGVQRMAADCGLGHLGVRTWTENVNASMPTIGVTFQQEGLFSEAAPGISLNMLLNDAKGTSVDFVKAMIANVSSLRVRELAIHDLMFSEGDRHGGNVQIDESSNLKLIDNDSALGIMYGTRLWKRPRGLDSIFIPGTERFLTLYRSKTLRVLDYRCHLPSPEGIGKDYPPQVAQCLQDFVGSSVEQLRRKYLIPRHDEAENLRERARDMLELGFEESLQVALEAEKTRYFEQMAEGAKVITSRYRPHGEPNCSF
ncbi:hypothetical protein CYMTET_55681 [Cymbomonas tetramitiformis]|uniref:PI3K/PI4K catalytic domain-containing protein n=1 Tax=Cymbomonas tetramitiformis TaxID=36881 RepID=A0AAE0BEC0_9CHLO|nr:hypothetical protein CYMTET_55681 [Cymbomonas tetramitiformis]